MQQLGFPTLPQLEMTADDFPSEDVIELADEWAQALEAHKAQQDEELLKSLSPPQDGPVIHNPFARSTAADASSTESEASTSGEPRVSSVAWPGMVHVTRVDYISGQPFSVPCLFSMLFSLLSPGRCPE